MLRSNQKIFVVMTFCFALFVFVLNFLAIRTISFAQTTTTSPDYTTSTSTTNTTTSTTSIRVEVSPPPSTIICPPYTIKVKTNLPAREVRIIYNLVAAPAYFTLARVDDYTWRYDFNFSDRPDGMLNMTIESIFGQTSSTQTFSNLTNYNLMINRVYCASRTTTTAPTTTSAPTVTTAPTSSTSQTTITKPSTSVTSTTTTSTKTAADQYTAVTGATGVEVTAPDSRVVSKEEVEKLTVLPEEKRETHKISKIKNIEVQAENSVVKKEAINFNGKAAPNSIIYLYIYSDPIIVSIQTDADGNWEYTLDKPLEKGKHEVYLVMQDETTKDLIRSEGQSFFITKAVAKSDLMDITGDKSLTLEDPFSAIFRQYIVYVGVTILLAIVVIISIYLRKRRVRGLENAE